MTSFLKTFLIIFCFVINYGYAQQASPFGSTSPSSRTTPPQKALDPFEGVIDTKPANPNLIKINQTGEALLSPNQANLEKGAKIMRHIPSAPIGALYRGASASWQIDVQEAGLYTITATTASLDDHDNDFCALSVGNVTKKWQPAKTGSFRNFIEAPILEAHLQKGIQSLKITPFSSAHGFNLSEIKISPKKTASTNTGDTNDTDVIDTNPDQINNDDTTITLLPSQALLANAKYEPNAPYPCIGRINEKSKIAWKVEIKKRQKYQIDIEVSSKNAEIERSRPFRLLINNSPCKSWKGVYTGSWYQFTKKTIGEIELPEGTHTLTIDSSLPLYKAINIGKVLITPIHAVGKDYITIKNDETTILPPSQAQLVNAKYNANDPHPCISYVNEKSKINWKIEVNKRQKYLIDIEVSSTNTEIEQSRPFRLLINNSPRKSWKGIYTGSWQKYTKTSIGEIELTEGIHTLTIESNLPGNKAVNIWNMLITPIHAVEKEPVVATAPPVIEIKDYITVKNNEVTTLLPSQAEVKNAEHTSRNEIPYLRKINRSEISWNLDIEQTGRYAVECNISSPNKTQKNAFEFVIGTQRIPWKSIYTRDWAIFSKEFICYIDLPKGKHRFQLLAQGDEKTSSNIGRICLTPYNLYKSIPVGIKETVLGQTTPTNLNLDRAFTDGPRLQDKPFPCIVDFHQGNSKVVWNLNSKGGAYILALDYSSPAHARKFPLAIKVGTTLLNPVFLNTGGTNTFVNKDLGFIQIPEGKSQLIIQGLTQDPSPLIDIKAVTLTPIAPVAELKKRPRLGMILPELQQLWGRGRQKISRPDIAINGGPNDKDRHLYEKIKDECYIHYWDQKGFNISAHFWKDRCVVLDLRRKNGFSPREAVELAKELVPGINFAGVPTGDKTTFTIYSNDAKQSYKLQNWKGYFEIKASELVRQLSQMPQQNAHNGTGTTNQSSTPSNNQKDQERQLENIKNVL